MVHVSFYPSTCTTEWLPTISTVCPLGLPPTHKKKQVVTRIHAQNKTQMGHLQRISRLFVAKEEGRKRKKKEEEEGRRKKEEEGRRRMKKKEEEERRRRMNNS